MVNDPKELELVRRLYDGPVGPDGIRIHYTTSERRSREEISLAARELESYIQTKELRKREAVLAAIRERMMAKECGTRSVPRQRSEHLWRS